jgi:hypothetical protein
MLTSPPARRIVKILAAFLSPLFADSHFSSLLFRPPQARMYAVYPSEAILLRHASMRPLLQTREGGKSQFRSWRRAGQILLRCSKSILATRLVVLRLIHHVHLVA